MVNPAPSAPIFQNAVQVVDALVHAAATELPRRINPGMTHEQKLTCAKQVAVEASQGRRLEIAQALRQSFSNGTDMSMVGRLVDYNGNIRARASNAYSIGVYARNSLINARLNGPVAQFSVDRIFTAYFKAAVKQKVAVEDIGERVAIVKEARAFNQGFSGINVRQFGEELDQLYQKNALQMQLEEQSDLMQGFRLTLPPNENPFLPLDDNWQPS